ncbi:hypothetical protein KUTeg_013637 [Tegillarca granosa]|uniref:G-protein coupled receptors family 1 profile domain-containing protein n=1 Tax=Tegillarca granosa TaxID=220873 RepID=A0ABQ9EU99_TEGGR|nr:hypothetical protein KUTeg_013637 [Tegillarca granosa]
MITSNGKKNKFKMAFTNQIDIDLSTESIKLDTSRALLLLTNSSYGNKSGITNLYDTLTVHEILYILLTVVLMPVIIITNVLVVTAVGKYKKLQTPTNFFIVSLAFADISIAIVLPFFTAVEIISENVVDTIACIAPNRILMMASGVSILMLSLIAYDRHLALAYPFRYVELMTKKKIIIFIFLSWLYSATIVWAPIITGWYETIQIPERYCTFEIMHQSEHLLFVSALFAPACLVIFVCYIRIYMIARHHARAIASLESSVQYNLQTHFITKDSKYAKTLAVVIGAFLLLWLPFQICLLYEVVTYHVMESWIRNYCGFLAFANSALNPWVYAYKSVDIRLAFKKISRSLSTIIQLGHIQDDERRISVVSNIYSNFGRDIHLSRTDSHFDEPHCSTVEVELHSDKDYLNHAMTAGDEYTGASTPICTCKDQKLPNTVTGFTDEQFKHLNTCPIRSQDPTKINRNRDSRASSKIVSFLEFLSMDDDFPVDCNLPTIGRTSVMSGMPNPYENPEQKLSAGSKSDMHKNVQRRVSQTSNKSNISDISPKKAISFVEVISFNNDEGKYNVNSENRTWNSEKKYSDCSQYGSPVGRTFNLHQADGTKSPVSKTNSYPGLQCSFSAMPNRKNAFVPEFENNVLSLMGFNSCDESSSVENFINFPTVKKSQGSAVSLNLDFHHNQGLILDAQTLNAQFATNNNGHQELNLQIGPRNCDYGDSKLKASRSYSAFVPPYKNVPRLNRQFSLDHSTGIY